MRALLASTLLSLFATSAAAQAAEPASDDVAEPPQESTAQAEPAPEPEPAPVQPLLVAAPSETPQPAGELALTEGEKQRGVPWRFRLGWSQSYNAAGVDRGTLLSYNPQYAWGFNLMFGWTFEDSDLRFSWEQGVGIELTDSETTVTRQELVLSDMTLGLAHPFTFELAEDRRWALTPLVQLTAPTSDASQAAETVMFAGVGLDAAYTYDAWLQGVMLNVFGSYTRRFATSNVATVDERYFCRPVNSDTFQNCDFQADLTTGRDAFSLRAGVFAQITESLTAGANVGFGWTLSHGLADVEQTLPTGTTVFRGDDATHLRTFRSLSFNVGYLFVPWLTVEAFVRNIFGERGPDGGTRAPFKAVDTTLGTGLTLSLDRLYSGSTGDDPRWD